MMMKLWGHADYHWSQQPFPNKMGEYAMNLSYSQESSQNVILSL